MIRPPKIDTERYVHGIFCEDVRQEVGETISIVGMYPSALLANSGCPFVLPKFSAIIWVVYPIEDDPPAISGTLEVPGASPVAIEVPITADRSSTPPDSTRTIAMATLRMANLVVKELGTIRLKIRVWGEQWLAASLRVIGPQDAGTLAAPSLTEPTVSPPVPGEALSEAPGPSKPRRRRSRRI